MNTQTTPTNALLTKRIMRRIYLVWAIRTILNPIFLKAVIVGILFWRSTEYVSYAHVIANAPRLTDVGNSVAFVQSAMMHAGGMTLALLLGVFIMAAWLFVDIVHRAPHVHA